MCDSLRNVNYFIEHVRKWNHRKSVGRVKGWLNASSVPRAYWVGGVLRPLELGGELDLIKGGDERVLAGGFAGWVSGALTESRL